MAKPKIFIASSTRTLEIARQLSAQLNRDYCEPDLWTDLSQRRVGRSILAMLKQATKEFDFAVIILARDDVMVTNAGDEIRKARDNCVFEAGLFIGAIGETRCLLLSGVEESDLPSDLRGLIHLSFTEPENLKNAEDCQKAIISSATRIENLVRQADRLEDRPLSQRLLLERERSIREGGELDMDQVVVASVQPLDVSYEAAWQVKRNMEDGNIRYVYFFQGNADGAEKTCQLLQMILLASFIETSDAASWRSRLDRLRINKSEILRNLERMCSNDRIKIFFLPSPPALQYCIHNAGNDKMAKLYLKRGEEFIQWASGSAAYQFWDEVRLARGTLEPSPANAVFYGVPGFNIKEASFRRTLQRVVAIYFPEIGEDVLSSCLGEISGANLKSAPS